MFSYIPITISSVSIQCCIEVINIIITPLIIINASIIIVIIISSIQFTNDERYVLRLLKDSIVITPVTDINGSPTARIDHKELTQFSISSLLSPHFITVFTPETSGIISINISIIIINVIIFIIIRNAFKN